MEHLCRAYYESYGFETYVARFQNCYGPHGSWNDGREKAPAALCRKIAMAKETMFSGIKVWGDGKATRSFTYVDDICEGIIRLVQTDHHDPITLGSDQVSTINELIDVISNEANYHPRKLHDETKPQGVRGRVFNHAKLEEVLGWKPETSLEEGIKHTYEWISNEVEKWQKERI